MIFCVIWGYFAGGVNELFSLAGLIIILAISLKVYGNVAAVLVKQLGISNVAAYICAFIMVFAAVYAGLKILKWLVNKQISESPELTSANKTAGMVIGFVKSGIVCLVIGVSLLLLPLGPQPKAALDGSFFVTVSKLVQPFIMGLFGDRELLEAADKLAQNPEKNSALIANNPQVQNIVSHPKVQEIANDPEIKKAVLNKDFVSLMSNQKFLSLMNDPEILQMVKQVDLAKLLNDTGADSAKSGETHLLDTRQIDAVKKNFEKITGSRKVPAEKTNGYGTIERLPDEEKK